MVLIAAEANGFHPGRDGRKYPSPPGLGSPGLGPPAVCTQVLSGTKDFVARSAARTCHCELRPTSMATETYACAV